MDNFAILIKPTLENFIKSPNKENTSKLKKVLEDIDDTQIKILETYILAPLMIKLDQLPEGKTSELKCEIINCIKCIISKSRIKNVNQLKTTLIIMLKQLHDFSSGLLHQNLSEEIKLSTLSCLNELFCKANSDVLEKFYTKQNSNLIGKIAATCVDILQIDKYKTLRISAVECLQSLFYVHDKADFDDIVLRDQVAESIFFFLPKIISVLASIAVSEEKNGLSLIILSIQVLGRILHLIYEDKIQNETSQYSADDFMKLLTENLKDAKLKEEKDDNIILGCNIKNKSVEEKIKIIQDIRRNQRWFEATSRKLRIIFVNLQVLQSSNNEKMRKEYSTLVTILLKKCNRNLHENTSVLLESIIALSQDEEPEIQKSCKNTLEDIKTNDNVLIKWDILFNEHMIKLPRVIIRNDDAEQIAEFLFLKGFFKNIPKENLCTIFSFTTNLERLVNNIIEALSLQFSNDLLYEEYSIKPIVEDSENPDFLRWKLFKNLSSSKVISLIQNTCECIGMSSINLIIFNHLIELMSQNPHISNEILLFLTFMTTNNETFEMQKFFIDLLLKELNDEKHWHLAILPDEAMNHSNEMYTSWHIDRTPGLYESAYEVRTTDIDYNADLTLNLKNNIVSRIDAQFNVLHTCVILNSIGYSSLVIKEDFKKYIFKFLHRVLLKSNNTNVMVHKAGSFALISIKNSLNYKNISELIQDYSDYLSYHINSSLKKKELNDIGINILSVVLQYSSLKSFTYLENIISTILEELTKSNESICTLAYLKVFNIFFLNMHKWIASLEGDDLLESVECTEDNVDFLITLKSILERPSDEFNEEAHTEEEYKKTDELLEDIENIPKEDEKPNLPKYIITILEILKRVLKFICSKQQMHKIVSLECFISGLPLLKDYEDEVLPLVHLLWYPYSERFKECDAVVMNRCLTLLKVLADCSKTFLQKRILNDVIPFLNQFLKSTMKNSLKNKHLTSTQEHKLQIKLLKSYAKIIIDMDMPQQVLEEATDIIILYLNKNQPQILQESAFSYLVEISKYNKPLIYVKLLYYQDDVVFKDNICNIFHKIKIKI